MKVLDRIVTDRIFYRLLEIFPGLLSWTLLISPILISNYQPNIVAYFILAYSVYWVYNSIKFVTYAYIGHRKLLYVTRQNWLERLQHEFPEEWNTYYYCGLIPYASESINIIRPTVESIATSNFPKEQKILCLSSEKALPAGKEIALQIQKEFKDRFAHIFITEHELQPGEIKGKSANQNHGGRFVYNQIKAAGINPDNVLITSNDADMLNHKEYHAYLLFKYLSEGERKDSRIYQPVPSDYTGYWDANFFSRLIITIGVQWRLALQQWANYRCTVYSFYSMSMKMLKKINFWDTDLIPEDERTQFNAFFTFGRDFKVIPLFIAVSGNPIQARNPWLAFKEQYKQIRRWAWGASEFAHSVTKAYQQKDLPWKIKLVPVLNQIRTSTEWVLASSLPLFGGLIPLLLNEDFRTTTLAYALPALLSILMQVGSIMILCMIYIEWRIAPKRPKQKGILFKLFTFGQWILLPYVGFMLSSLPALDAQTRLMFNKRLVYVESKKEK